MCTPAREKAFNSGVFLLGGKISLNMVVLSSGMAIYGFTEPFFDRAIKQKVPAVSLSFTAVTSYFTP